MNPFMIKKTLLVFLSSSLFCGFSQNYEPIRDKILTSWDEGITPENVWQEYPRPQMVREHWQNLNGLWEYAITLNSVKFPEDWQQSILVPFAIETPLSGVGKRIESNEVIWYRRSFELDMKDIERQLLNFEGVDYKCMVWVNGELAGSHTGGNLPFTFDITEIATSGTNELVLRVIDGTDDFDLYQLRGKQKRKNGGIWYTPSSGIWAPVWIESVPQTYIESLKLLADMNGKLSAEANILGESNVNIKVTVSLDGKIVSQKNTQSTALDLYVKNAKLWSPKSPTLYDLKIELLTPDGEVIDEVTSYVGFRTVGRASDEAGNWHFTLNGKILFHFGPLDQGWWPGGFLLPPSDEAIIWEMNYLKKAGFNMIRKHKKVEPRRYYYHADRLGFVIWQDQTSGGSGGSEWPKWKRLHALSDNYEVKNQNWWSDDSDPLDADWPIWAHEQYMSELKTMVDILYNHPSIVVWTTFNERWGQHQSLNVGTWIKTYDPSRLLNIASGGNFFEVGDIADQHQYPHPDFPLEVPLYNDYIKVVGEYGGHGWPVEDHLWETGEKSWGYGGLPKTLEEYQQRYIESCRVLGELKKKGISGGVYTQTTDVEREINGLITYDRKVMKIEPEKLYKIHKKAGLID